MSDDDLIRRRSAYGEFPDDWRDRAQGFKGSLKMQKAWSDGFNACRHQIAALPAVDVAGVGTLCTWPSCGCTAKGSCQPRVRTALIDTPAPAPDKVARLVASVDQLRGSVLRLIMRDENCIDRPCHRDSDLCECRAKLVRIMVETDVALAALKGGDA